MHSSFDSDLIDQHVCTRFDSGLIGLSIKSFDWWCMQSRFDSDLIDQCMSRFDSGLIAPSIKSFDKSMIV